MLPVNAARALIVVLVWVPKRPLIRIALPHERFLHWDLLRKASSGYVCDTEIPFPQKDKKPGGFGSELRFRKLSKDTPLVK
jgi:hypothetical protein